VDDRIGRGGKLLVRPDLLDDAVFGIDSGVLQFAALAIHGDKNLGIPCQERGHSAVPPNRSLFTILLSSFPRKRESRATCSAICRLPWIPAFAGMTEEVGSIPHFSLSVQPAPQSGRRSARFCGDFLGVELQAGRPAAGDIAAHLPAAVLAHAFEIAVLE